MKWTIMKYRVQLLVGKNVNFRVRLYTVDTHVLDSAAVPCAQKFSKYSAFKYDTTVQFY